MAPSRLTDELVQKLDRQGYAPSAASSVRRPFVLYLNRDKRHGQRVDEHTYRPVEFWNVKPAEEAHPRGD